MNELTQQNDLSCRMKRCKRCDDWMPETEFYLRRRGQGSQRLSYCKGCMAGWKETAKRKRVLCPESPFARRIPEDTVQDYVDHALPYWLRRDLRRVALALSHAPATIRKAAIRELMAVAA
jgi:hypothetical protein